MGEGYVHRSHLYNLCNSSINLKLSQRKRLFNKCKINISQEQQLYFFPTTLNKSLQNCMGRRVQGSSLQNCWYQRKIFKNCNRMTQETMGYLHYGTAHSCEKRAGSICTEKIRCWVKTWTVGEYYNIWQEKRKDNTKANTQKIHKV